MLSYANLAQPKQVSPQLDSAMKYRSVQPDKTINFARRAFAQAAGEEKNQEVS